MAMAGDESPPWEKHLERFGWKQFRPGQRKVIETVMDQQDCLVVMPTGGGKSLCYQLPAVASGGLTLVISPLIALMKDQVDQLVARNIRATYINSTLDPAEQYARLDGMAAGEYELVYVVPERFRSSRFHESVQKADLRLLAVDEAHCVSEWGHDFRPDYSKIGHRHRLGAARHCRTAESARTQSFCHRVRPTEFVLHRATCQPPHHQGRSAD